MENSSVTSVYAQQPVAGEDYTVVWADNANWLQDGNGFYYYKNAVKPNEATDTLIKECTLIGEAPAGYKLAVEIVASAIQASPETVAETHWYISVENGEIIGVQTSREVGNE